MRPRWGKANEEEKDMTEPPKKRVLDPSKMRPLSQADLDRIYGPHGLSFYSPVRPRRTSPTSVKQKSSRRSRKTANEGTHE